jgi:hypothetical protein
MKTSFLILSYINVHLKIEITFGNTFDNGLYFSKIYIVMFSIKFQYN